MNDSGRKPSAVLQTAAILLLVFAAPIAALYLFLLTLATGYSVLFALLPIAAAVFCILLILLRPGRARRNVGIVFAGVVLLSAVCLGVQFAHNAYDRYLTVEDGAPFDTADYLPFVQDSKVARLDGPASLRLGEPLPVVDGATALFPVYSAFVGAVYPPDILPLGAADGPFQFHNTIGGYALLAKGEVDVMFGAYPSEEQIGEARAEGRELRFTPIGREGFVFFVNRNNPVESLTSEEIRGIYSGEITNWKEVGGRDEPILAFQRNQGSGSQSALVRFMGDAPLMTPPTEQVEDLMSGIIERASDYRNHKNAIGFSFRYYADQLVGNKGIKLLAVDGVAPTVENIRAGRYPLTSEFYAATTQSTEQIDALLEWILSPEGQELIERTGDAGINP